MNRHICLLYFIIILFQGIDINLLCGFAFAKNNIKNRNTTKAIIIVI
jgi:hypothetical protein